MKEFVVLKTKEMEYNLKFKHNVMCEIENQLKLSMTELSAVFNSGEVSMNVIRTLLKILINESGNKITPRETGDLIDEIGLGVAAEKISECIVAAFPSAEDEEDPEPSEGSEAPEGDDQSGN